MTSVKYHNIIETGPEKAILVGLITPRQDERRTKEYLDELEFLAETAGAQTVKRFTQRANGPSSVTYLGTGKLQEIRAYIVAEEDNVLLICKKEDSSALVRKFVNEVQIKRGEKFV